MMPVPLRVRRTKTEGLPERVTVKIRLPSWYGAHEPDW